jgi:hypothetical protein
MLNASQALPSLCQTSRTRHHSPVDPVLSAHLWREPQSLSHAFAASVMDTHIEPASMAVMLQRRSVQISADTGYSH